MVCGGSRLIWNVGTSVPYYTASNTKDRFFIHIAVGNPNIIFRPHVLCSLSFTFSFLSFFFFVFPFVFLFSPCLISFLLILILSFNIPFCMSSLPSTKSASCPGGKASPSLLPPLSLRPHILISNYYMDFDNIWHFCYDTKGHLRHAHFVPDFFNMNLVDLRIYETGGLLASQLKFCTHIYLSN